jgi:hypothetical protein
MSWAIRNRYRTHNCSDSHHSDCCMQGSWLQRSMCDVHLLELCIEPLNFPFIELRGRVLMVND